jgi:hypothetical protein
MKNMKNYIQAYILICVIFASLLTQFFWSGIMNNEHTCFMATTKLPPKKGRGERRDVH